MTLMSATLHALAARWDAEADKTDGGLTDGLRQAAAELRETLATEFGSPQPMWTIPGLPDVIVEITQGRVTLRHEGCKWFYVTTVRGPAVGRPAVTLGELFTTGAIHLGGLDGYEGKHK